MGSFLDVIIEAMIDVMKYPAMVCGLAGSVYGVRQAWVRSGAPCTSTLSCVLSIIIYPTTGAIYGMAFPAFEALAYVDTDTRNFVEKFGRPWAVGDNWRV
jgi:hypothetical protein